VAGAVAAVITPLLVFSPADRPAPTPSVTPSGVVLSNPPVPGQVVPWIEAPAPAPGSVSPRPTARPCAAADLAATATGTSLGTSGGASRIVIAFSDVGTSRCTLLDSPVLVTVGADGVAQTVPVDPGTVFDDPGTEEQPPTLDPGESAQRTLSTARSCGDPTHPTRYANLALVLPDAHRIPVPGLVLSTTCTVRASAWYRTVPASPGSAPTRYLGLVAGIDAPTRVARGADLTYTVRLSNPGPTVVFDPCPVLVQRLGARTELDYANCAVATGVPGGSSIRLRMRLHVPVDATIGPTDLGWGIQESGTGAAGRSAATSTTITVE
jgi:hypothetical protein